MLRGTGSMMRVACVVVAVLMLTMSAFAVPNTRNRDEIPDQYKWNLSDIYANWEEWEAGLQEMQTKMAEFAELQGTLAESPENVLRAYQINDELGVIAFRVFRYPQLMLDTDTRNNDVSARLQQVSIAFYHFNVATAWFTPEVLAIPWETMEQWLNDNPEFADYRFTIEDTYRQQEHVLDEQGEQLLSFGSQFTGSPGNIYQQLSTSDIVYPEVVLADGDTVTASYGQYSAVLGTNRNQADRSLFSREFYGVYQQNINTYASIYASILQRDWFLAQARNYPTTLHADLDGNNIPVEVYENLVSTVYEGVAPLQRYHELRARMMELDSYHPYDGRIPLVEFDEEYPFDEVTEMIIESVEVFGEEYQNQLREALEGGWIDVYENDGKRSGAYSAGVYGVHPYMLLNYTDTLEDLFTLQHELGHTMHTVLSYGNQPFANAHYTIFVAEVASTLNEALLLDYMLERTEDPEERIALLQHMIDSIVGTFYTQVLFADFERRAHVLVEEGQPITSDVLNATYMELLQHYYGDSMEIDDYYEATWSRIGHFFRSPYYVYQYATCYASSAKILQDITTGSRRERRAAVERYLDLLKSGGSDYPMEQLRAAGVDLSNPEVIQAVVDQLDTLVGQLEEEINRL